MTVTITEKIKNSAPTLQGEEAVPIWAAFIQDISSKEKLVFFSSLTLEYDLVQDIAQSYVDFIATVDFPTEQGTETLKVISPIHILYFQEGDFSIKILIYSNGSITLRYNEGTGEQALTVFIPKRIVDSIINSN